MRNLCTICGGSGSLVRFAPTVFWDCLYCGGSGVRVQHGPRTFKEWAGPAATEGQSE